MTTSAPLIQQTNLSIPRSHHGSVSVNDYDIQPKPKTLNHIKRMSRLGGFAGASFCYKAILGLYMIGSFVCSVVVFRETVCIWLSIYVTICQIDALMCYIFGIVNIDESFIFQLSKHITYLDQFHSFQINDTDSSTQLAPLSKLKRLLKMDSKYIFSHFISGQTLLNREMFIISFMFLLAYSSALVIVFDMPWNKQFFDSNGDTVYYMIIVVTGILDVVRYTPSIILILLIRLYFKTFSSKLTAFRQRHDIITRFEKLDDIPIHQSMVRNNINLSNVASGRYIVIQNDPNTAAAVIDEKTEEVGDHAEDLRNCLFNKYSSLTSVSMGSINQKNSASMDLAVSPVLGSGYLVTLNMSHYEFKNELETIIFPYRNMCRSFRVFFISYLAINCLCFIFVLITTIQGFAANECDAENVYYLHYVTEMAVYFLGWVSLMVPLAENHRQLRSLNRDVKTKIVFKTATEQILIHQYLDSVVEASPFCVGYIMPTYSKLVFVFYILFSVVGGQLWSFFQYNSNKL